MGMTPQEIQEKHFHDAFRGYSHEEVDLFLDEVAVAFERLYRENQSFMRRVVDLEEQLKRAQEATGSQPPPTPETFEEDPAVTESTLKRMLLIAQETADRAVQEARQRAREIQEQARVRADEMMEHAERRVRELSSERMEKEKELERAKEALRRFDQQYRASFRVFIESQLEALKDLPAAPSASDMDLAQRPSETQMSPPSIIDRERAAASPEVGMETVAMGIEGFGDEATSLQEGNIEESDLDSGPVVEAEATTEPVADGLQWQPESPAPVEGPEESELVRTGNSGTPAGVPPPPIKAPIKGPVEGPIKGPIKAEGQPDEAARAQAAENRTRRDRRKEREAGTSDIRDAEEDRLIRELFWGDEE